MLRGAYGWARSRRTQILIFMAMGGLYFFTNFQRVGVPGTIFDEIQSDLGVSATAVTALAAVFLYIYAGMQIFIGAGADRFGAARMVVAGGALLALGSALFPLAKSLPLLYACRGLVGLGASFMYLSIVKETVTIFEARLFPPMLGVLLVVGYSGGLVATAPLQRAVAAWGWRSTFLAAGLACVAVYIFAAALFARSGRLRHEPSEFTFGSVRALFRTRAIYPLLVCGPLNFSMYYVLQIAVGKKFLEDVCGLTPASASNATFAMLLIVVVGSLAGGFLPAFIGHRRKPFVIATSAGVAAGCGGLALGMVAGAPAWWFVACYLVFGLTNVTSIVGTPLLKEASPPNAAAFAIGVLNGATYAMVAITSNAAGLVLDAYAGGATVTEHATVYPAAAYTTMFFGMLALSVVSLAVSTFAPETRGVQRMETAVAGGLRPLAD